MFDIQTHVYSFVQDFRKILRPRVRLEKSSIRQRLKYHEKRNKVSLSPLRNLGGSDGGRVSPVVHRHCTHDQMLELVCECLVSGPILAISGKCRNSLTYAIVSTQCMRTGWTGK